VAARPWPLAWAALEEGERGGSYLEDGNYGRIAGDEADVRSVEEILTQPRELSTAVRRRAIRT